MKKVRVVLNGNGDFFHERAVWVTFAESKVTKQEVFGTAVPPFFCPETKEGKNSPLMVGYSATAP